MSWEREPFSIQLKKFSVNNIYLINFPRLNGYKVNGSQPIYGVCDTASLIETYFNICI